MSRLSDVFAKQEGFEEQAPLDENWRNRPHALFCFSEDEFGASIQAFGIFFFKGGPHNPHGFHVVLRPVGGPQGFHPPRKPKNGIKSGPQKLRDHPGNGDMGLWTVRASLTQAVSALQFSPFTTVGDSLILP